MSINFTGDIMLDHGPGHTIAWGGDPFAPVASILSGADLTAGNLECVITRKGEYEDKPYTFKAPLEALPLLKKYFSALSLANNHSGDWGKAGFADMLTLLDQAGIPYFGGGRNREAALRPRILVARGRRIALLGYCDYPPKSFAASGSRPGTAWLREKDVLAGIRAARAQADFVVLFFHWGIEIQPKPEPYQVELAHKFIDAGADAVIGAHPHVVQPLEWYRDRPILYSLGNLVFDYWPVDPKVWHGWIARLTFETGARPRVELFDVEMDPAGTPHPAPPQ